MYTTSRQIYKKNGFTIVELLIVVVVIAILAAITIVSYSGITQSAKESALKTELVQYANKLEIYKVTNNVYPGSADVNDAVGIDTSGGTFQYTGGNQTYCLSATSEEAGLAYHISNEGGVIQGGVCAGHTDVGGAPVASMQSFTSSQCSALTTYTGVNEEAVITLSDDRDGTTRTYQVAKLADGRCWMLNNLKLGNTSSTVTLTPSDTDISSNFVLPQVINSGTEAHDTPLVFGPVTGDTGSGATNYGFLYNWTAATAGETRTSMPVDSGNAPHSICPAGWRLPTGGTSSEFTMLNAKMNDPNASAPSTGYDTGYYENWQTTGPFKGVLAGQYSIGAFSSVGIQGFYWSSSSNTFNVNNAIGASYTPTSVSASSINMVRSRGEAIRCILN